MKNKIDRMNIILQQIEVMSRMDQLIRMQATGSPVMLSKKLGVSKTTVYRIINTMKALEAPVLYDTTVQSFVYDKPTKFTFGFYEN